MSLVDSKTDFKVQKTGSINGSVNKASFDRLMKETPKTSLNQSIKKENIQQNETENPKFRLTLILNIHLFFDVWKNEML